MIVLEDSLVDYIFLSRKIPLPLSALKIIKERISFQDVIHYSASKFKQLLYELKKNEDISLRNIEDLISNFGNKDRDIIFNKIRLDLKICEENNIKCFTYFDKNYPPLLKTIKDPPKLIFIKGEIKSEDNKAVAIVGTRTPTTYGKKMAMEIAKRLSESGFTIISGFARGIDTIALNSALENGGRAIGVIASGILNLYPKENEVYVEKLIKNGALISERFPKESVNKRALQIRNRITSGLGLGNIFIEGNKFSGTRWQLKFGREEKRIPIAVKPIDESCEQAFVPNLVITQEKGEVITNLNDIEYIIEVLEGEYAVRKKRKGFEKKSKDNQTSILRYK